MPSKPITETSSSTTTTKKPSSGGSGGYNAALDSQKAAAGQVYVTKTGSKYHSSPNCGRTKNASPIDLDEAIALGYEACQKCYG